MKITVYESREVILNEAQQKEAARAVLSRIVHPGEYIRKKDGKEWLFQDDPNWRHGSVSEVPVREATELDLAVMLLVNHLSDAK